MPPGNVRILQAMVAVFVAATALHVGWIMAHEPFAFDAWNVAVDTNAQPITIGRFFEFWWHEYTHSNPRIVQVFAYLAYKLDYFAVIATPFALLALALATFVLGTGRWPGRGAARDLGLLTISIGFVWFALPEVGKTLFNRAYGANYFYGAVIQLWFLVPLRLVPHGRASSRWCVAYLFAGVFAGMCNEHTGPTLCAFVLGYAWWTGRRTGQRPVLAWAGAAGVVIGFAAIFFAPGQGERYDGLAQRMSLVGRLLHRGITGNLEIVRDLVVAAAPVLGVITIAAMFAVEDQRSRERRRDAVRVLALGMLASATITATLFVSPKLGSRFFLLPTALLMAGFLGLAEATLTTPRRLLPFIALAIAASIVSGMRTIPLYARASAASESRLAALAAAPQGSVFTAEAFEQVQDSWWFLGDDLRDVRKRDMVAKYFGLARVLFRQLDARAPLGVSDIRLVASVASSPGGRVDLPGSLELELERGTDLPALHRELAVAIERLRVRRASDKLDHIEVAVEFGGQRPSLPRPRVLVARWRPEALEAYGGTIERERGSKRRRLKLPPQVVGSDREIFLYEVGGSVRRLGTARDESLTYVASKNGVNWALACDADECFVIAVVRIGR
jgi:hypothetical protein